VNVYSGCVCQVGELPGDKEEVCVLCARPKETGALGEAVLATGLQNGSVKLWELPKQTLTVTLRLVTWPLFPLFSNSLHLKQQYRGIPAVKLNKTLNVRCLLTNLVRKICCFVSFLPRANLSDRFYISDFNFL